MKMFIFSKGHLAVWSIYGVIPNKYLFKVSNKVTRATHIGDYSSVFR